MDIEKVKQIAHEKYGKELTDEQAAEYAKKYGHLSDEALDNVAGGFILNKPSHYHDPYHSVPSSHC